jgi:hypothetical protein
MNYMKMLKNNIQNLLSKIYAMIYLVVLSILFYLIISSM